MSKDTWGGACLGFAIGMIFGGCLFYWACWEDTTHSALTAGAAHYDTHTGNFKWGAP